MECREGAKVSGRGRGGGGASEEAEGKDEGEERGWTPPKTDCVSER